MICRSAAVNGPVTPSSPRPLGGERLAASYKRLGSSQIMRNASEALCGRPSCPPDTSRFLRLLLAPGPRRRDVCCLKNRPCKLPSIRWRRIIMPPFNCINIMPSNDHYVHQNSHDNKAITILRAQLAQHLFDAIITAWGWIFTKTWPMEKVGQSICWLKKLQGVYLRGEYIGCIVCVCV